MFGTAHSPQAKNFVSHKIGKRIKYFRKLQDISLGLLGEMVNLSSQQISNYETGKHRIAIDRLFDISLALCIPLVILIDEKNL